ncbi:MAG: DUF5329 family protein [Luteimonas sp.]
MDRTRIRIPLCLVLALSLLVAAPWFAQAAGVQVDPEISALIDKVEHAHDVSFIRNGSAHGAQEAAAHLRRKLAAANGRIGSAEQFIDAIGTRSSMTGIAYRVRFADGREIDSAAWLRQLLRQLRAERLRSARPAESTVPVPTPARR